MTFSTIEQQIYVPIYGGDMVFPSMEDAQILRVLLVMHHAVDELYI